MLVVCSGSREQSYKYLHYGWRGVGAGVARSDVPALALAPCCAPCCAAPPACCSGAWECCWGKWVPTGQLRGGAGSRKRRANGGLLLKQGRPAGMWQGWNGLYVLVGRAIGSLILSVWHGIEAASAAQLQHFPMLKQCPSTSCAKPHTLWHKCPTLTCWIIKPICCLLHSPTLCSAPFTYYYILECIEDNRDWG